MPQNRFDYILSNLHFSDNTAALSTEDPGYDELHKIRPLITEMQHTFPSAAITETCQAIDKMMIGFKGRHRLKFYMPTKPTKWGYKLLARAGVSGYFTSLKSVVGVSMAHSQVYNLLVSLESPNTWS